jgi:hypothetical protein
MGHQQNLNAPQKTRTKLPRELVGGLIQPDNLSIVESTGTRYRKGGRPATEDLNIVRLAVTPELKLDLLLSGVILAFAIPAWAEVVWKSAPRLKLWKPLSLVTLSLLEGLLFVNITTVGPLTLDYSLRFAALGIPLSVLAIILSLRRSIDSTGTGVMISSALSLLMWLFLVTAH